MCVYNSSSDKYSLPGSTVMLMVRFLVSEDTLGCWAVQVYSPPSSADTFFSVSLEDGRIQSPPWESDKRMRDRQKDRETHRDRKHER